MDKTKYKMGKISYINASPVFYGLDNGLLPDWLEMVSRPPSVLNHMVINGDIVISPISTAFYAMHHEDLLVLPDFSISCHGSVMSVLLMTRYPVEQLDKKKVFLTEESATAASFVKMFFSKMNINPLFETRSMGSIVDIDDSVDAALIIGDAALTQPWESIFEYRLDIGDLWFQLTGLPFVFAVWVVRRSFALEESEIVKKIIMLLHASRKAGLGAMDKIIEAGAFKLDLTLPLIKKYYNHLYCDFDLKKLKALEMFFDFLYEEEILEKKVKVELFS